MHCSFCPEEAFEITTIDEDGVFIIGFCKKHYGMLASNVIIVCPKCLNVEMEDKADHMLKHPESVQDATAAHLWMMGYKIRYAIAECEFCRNMRLGWDFGGDDEKETQET